ncbi:MAG TPA: methylated-DNA--[protein]-cysteine S-methyltransferase [candidate division Zixibacteria bacterium]|nr:methylated-DNA--[protein]-cysteine S-methyltransferase [candidate division Zixibacteria bacterium]
MITYGKTNVAPLGVIWIAVSANGLHSVKIGGTEADFVRSLTPGDHEAAFDNDSISIVADQLQEYLSGDRNQFELEIDWGQLTEFQESALRRTYEIPLGEVMTYGQVAESLGRSAGAARAVGRAMATNPIPIIIPCHRVVGAKGELTGYGGAGGLETKAWLLTFEGQQVIGNFVMSQQPSAQMRMPW